MSGNTSFSTDKLMRARLIASGRLRPRNDNELDPIQLPPGTVVYRIEPQMPEHLPWGAKTFRRVYKNQVLQ